MEGVWRHSDVGRATIWYCSTYQGEDATPKCLFLTTCLPNKIHVVRDGEEALDFLFARGAYSQRTRNGPPKVILLDLKLPKVNDVTA